MLQSFKNGGHNMTEEITNCNTQDSVYLRDPVTTLGSCNRFKRLQKVTLIKILLKASEHSREG